MLTLKEEDTFNLLLAEGREEEAYDFYREKSRKNLKKKYEKESLRLQQANQESGA